MNKQSKSRAVVLTAAVGAVTLAACSASPEADPTASEPGSPPAAIQDEVVVALSGDIDNFDPHTNQLIIYGYGIREPVFCTLVGFDVALEVQPELATYDVNDDATEFTFQLEDEALFHDGTPVDADAVIQSLERAASASDSIWSPRLADVASYDAPDDSTVVITLNSPNAAFLSSLASIAIVAPSNFDDVGTSPIGCGPYSFTSWTANTEIVLERFDDYFGEAPATERIVLKPISDEQVALNNLYSGSVDIISSVSAATVEQVDSARAVMVEPEASNTYDLIEFNSSGTLADPRVRQALAHALDKESIRDIAFGGRGSIGWSSLPESSWAYVEQDGYEYDLAVAETLLEEAGASGLEFTLEIPSGFPTGEQIARVWQSSLAEIGVTLRPNVTELSTWLDAYVTRDYDATWNVTYVEPDPNNFFEVILLPHLQDDYPNETVSALITDGLRTADQDERAEIYSELQAIVAEELPVMTVQSVPITSLTRPEVTGYEVNALGWSLLTQVTVTTD